jgi:uncharacterized protein involved in exopolysaccharide biosynthesis
MTVGRERIDQDHAGAGEARALAECLRRQVTLLADLDRLSRDQRDLIASADGPALADLMSRRQAVIDALTACRREAEPLRDRWAAAGSPLREHVEALESRVVSSAGEVAARDAQDLAALRTRRDALASELVGLARDRRVAGVYAPQAPSRPLYQDRSA